jgi:hypothetical protein
MKIQMVLMVTVIMTVCVCGGNAIATEWYNPEMLRAFGKPGDTIVSQEWTTREALSAYGKPGDTVRDPTAYQPSKPHKKALKRYTVSHNKRTVR